MEEEDEWEEGVKEEKMGTSHQDKRRRQKGRQREGLKYH